MVTDRLEVRKTYKLFIGGAFPRSESGRTYPVESADGRFLAHACLASRKDARDAVAAARKAQEGWVGRTAYNRAQILYRVAEMLEGRAAQFREELAVGGSPDPAAEVAAAVDRWVWYAGWADKFGQVLGTHNPVAGPFFTFSVPEPSGVAAVVCPDDAPLLALVSRVAPAIVAGNTVVVVASERWPLVSMTLAEVLATSDLPGGVVNLLTGRRAELAVPLAAHREVDVLDLTGVDDPAVRTEAERAAADHVTRVRRAEGPAAAWFDPSSQSPYAIADFCEIKTVWHPMGL